MQLQTLISSSNKFYYVDRFDDILKIALALKAQLYYADAITNKIFGFYEEHYSILEVDVPFKITNSVFFAGYSAPKEAISNHKTYFYMEEYPYILFPENRRAEVMNGNIDLRYPDFIDTNYSLIDRMTGKALDDSFIAYDQEKWFKIPEYINQIILYNQRVYTLDSPMAFEDMQTNEVISEVMSNKITEGRKLLIVNAYGRNYGLYIFKSMLGPVTKADKLTLFIQQDRFESQKFMATFRVFKKKTKLDIPELTSMTIDTHAFILNLF